MSADRLSIRLLQLAAFVGLAVTFYDLINFKHHTQSVSAILTYYGLPLAMAGLCLWATRLPASWRGLFAACGISVVIALYAAEAYVTFFNPVIERFPGTPPPADRRTKYEVIRDLRAQGVDAVPYLNILNLVRKLPDGTWRTPLRDSTGVLWPLGSVSHATVVVCREAAEYLIYRTDRYGFSNPDATWDRPVSVAAVGDSFTHGACVSPRDSFMGRIRATIPATLNLGVNGTGALSHLAAIREYMPTLKPATVLWVFFAGNDIVEMSDEFESPTLRRYLEPGFSQGLIQRQAAIDAGFRRMTERALDRQRAFSQLRQRQRWFNFSKLHSVRLLLRISRNREVKPTREQFEQFSRLLGEAASTVRGWGGRLFLVYLPGWTRYHGTLRHGYEDLIRDNVLDAARKNNVPIIDGQAALEAAAEDPLSLYQGHLNERGNAIIGRAIVSRITGR